MRSSQTIHSRNYLYRASQELDTKCHGFHVWTIFLGYPTSLAGGGYNVTGDECGARPVKGGAPPEPLLSLGEMVVPQAKTLDTHKIYFDLSPPIRSRRRQTANYPSLTYWYVAEPTHARISEQHFFQQSIYPVRNRPD